MPFVPLKHQITGAEFLIRSRWAILSDQMGTGKGATVLLAAQRIDLPLLVICPAFLKGVWASEIQKHFPEMDYYVCTSKDIPKKPAKVTIINYEHLDKIEKIFAQVGIVVWEEVHAIKNTKAARTKRAHALVQKYKPRYVWGVSGTPIKNNIPEWWSILRMMGLCPDKTNGLNAIELYRNYWGFCTHFCYEVRKKIGRATYRSYEGFKNQEDFHRLLRGKLIRRTLKDTEIELPEEVNITMPIAKLTQEQALQNAYADYELSKCVSTSTPEKVRAALDKVSYTTTLLREFIEQGNTPFIVFTDYVSVAKSLYGEFAKDGAAMLTGEMPADERFEACERFQRGEIPIIIATIGATKEGLTLTAAQYMIFNDLCWVPADLSQAKARIRRIGQKRTCFYYYVSAPGIDENIAKKLIEKSKLASQSLAITGNTYDFLEF